MPEHCGGDRWSILHGDSLQIIRQFVPNSFDAIITDPPYASGGSSQTTKNRSTNEKYSSMSKEKALPDFDSDQMDQLSWMFWTAAWLQDARRIAKPGAPVCLFIDWRQLPAMTLALQWAGWTWRGVAVWDKVASRPQKGRFRQQSEYIVWGSNGKMPLERNVGCLPGVFRYPNPQNRIHVTEKPLQLMKDVIQICEPGGRILDPFAGSGTTAHAVLNMNKADGGHRKFILVEMMDYADSITAERVKRVIRGYGEGKNAVEGTGGNFSFYDLGEPLLVGDCLNEAVAPEKIREYIWFMETKQPYAPPSGGNPYYLGKHNNTGYYFYYEPQRVTVLDYAFLSTITEKADGTVIYADRCSISEDKLAKMGVTFKKIPRDISRL